MKYSKVLIFEIIFIIVLLLTSLDLSFPQSINLSGYVKDRFTQKPVDGVSVEIIDMNNSKKYTTQSYSLGNWSIDITRIQNQETPTETFTLEQNYPNPFNPSTKIGFTIRKAGYVEILVHNILGEELDKHSWFLSPGLYSIDWYSKGSSGVLFYTIKTGNEKITKKMIQLDGGNGGFSGLNNLHSSASIMKNTALMKNNSLNYKIIFSKLGYLPDSILVNSPGNSIDINLTTIHRSAFVIDLHNDLLEATEGIDYSWGDKHTTKSTDIPRLIEGGYDAQIFAIWCEPRNDSNYFNKSLNFYKIFSNQIKINESKIGQARNENEIISLNNQNKIAGIIGIEGGHAIENSIEKLIGLYNLGARYLTITWNNSISWAISAGDTESKTKGLSEFGKTVIKTMDSLGMIIDIAHTGIKTIEDIQKVTKNPIINSHAGVYALRAHTRNMTDNQIKSIASSGGVIGVVFYPPFLSASGKTNTDSVVKHIDYIKNLVGIDYIAIGSDYDGMGNVSAPIGLEDVAKFPNLTLALLKKGYTIPEVKKILGENFLRVFRKICK